MKKNEKNILDPFIHFLFLNELEVKKVELY